MSQQGKVFKQRYNRNMNTLRICSKMLFSGNVEIENVATGERFKQRYYRNIKTLRLCRPLLLLGND